MFTAKSGLLALALLLSTACSNAFSLRHDGRDRIREERDFSKFVELVEKEKGLRDEFEKGDRMTVFVPNNNAVKRFEERQHEHRAKNRDEDEDRDDIRMEDIIRYHIVHDEELEKHDLRDGVLLKSNLKLDTLDGERQRIRISKIFNEVYLNMYARVDIRKEYEADNGVIWALDEVLVPPPDIVQVLFSLPSKFSTTTSALCRLKALGKIEELKGATMFVPDNSAWEELGFKNLYHLFSEHGHKDLKKILMYHGSDELVYSTKMMKEEKMEIPTSLKGEKLTIRAMRRREGGGGDEDGDEDDDDDRDDDGNRRGRRRPRHGHKQTTFFGSDDEHRKNPNDYIFMINNGEARIRFNDGVAENGVIHVISEVLIPKGVDLPHRRSAESLHSM
ncbi:hypothetical protein HDU97_001926 [Phlyctochytrium planicorne]|nr:hypothetical protein HDU97_001926 [Phlyctochytrium planicorne]